MKYVIDGLVSEGDCKVRSFLDRAKIRDIILDNLEPYPSRLKLLNNSNFPLVSPFLCNKKRQRQFFIKVGTSIIIKGSSTVRLEG